MVFDRSLENMNTRKSFVSRNVLNFQLWVMPWELLVNLNFINLFRFHSFVIHTLNIYIRQERWKVRCAHNVMCQALSNIIVHVLTTMPLTHAFPFVIQTAFICGWYWCSWAINWASTSVSPPLPVTEVTDRNQA